MPVCFLMQRHTDWGVEGRWPRFFMSLDISEWPSFLTCWRKFSTPVIMTAYADLKSGELFWGLKPFDVSDVCGLRSAEASVLSGIKLPEIVGLSMQWLRSIVGLSAQIYEYLTDESGTGKEL